MHVIFKKHVLLSRPNVLSLVFLKSVFLKNDVFFYKNRYLQFLLVTKGDSREFGESVNHDSLFTFLFYINIK